jgi:hypothetical protein
MDSNLTQLEDSHIQVPRVAMWTAPLLSQEHLGSVRRVAASLQRFTGNRLPLVPELRGRILQAPSPNHALQPTPWIAVAFPSPLVRCG